jgi:hypothetical protein
MSVYKCVGSFFFCAACASNGWIVDRSNEVATLQQIQVVSIITIVSNAIKRSVCLSSLSS